MSRGRQTIDILGVHEEAVFDSRVIELNWVLQAMTARLGKDKGLAVNEFTIGVRASIRLACLLHHVGVLQSSSLEAFLNHALDRYTSCYHIAHLKSRFFGFNPAACYSATRRNDPFQRAVSSSSHQSQSTLALPLDRPRGHGSSQEPLRKHLLLLH
jgi:hypothetical protein